MAVAVVVAMAVAVIVVVRVAVTVVVADVMAASVAIIMAVLTLAVVIPIIVVAVVSIRAAVVPAVVRPRVRTTNPVSVVITSSIGPDEAMGAPAVGIAPIGPRADSEKDSVIEITRAVKVRRGAGVRRKLIVAVGANGRSADLDAEGNLGISLGRKRKKRKRQGRAKEREGSAPEKGFSFRNHI